MDKKGAKKINKKDRTIIKYWRSRSEDNLRKNKIYGNCKVYSPSGNLMFLCIEKKAQWYLDRVDETTGRPLAKSMRHINPFINFLMTIFMIKPNGLRVKLLFEPKQEGNVGDKYSLSKKDNKCVVTGSKNLSNLTKHHITPYCYRRYMPEKYKSANSHDVVPILDEAHYAYEKEADKLKFKIAKMYDAPIEGVSNVNHKLFYAIKSAIAIKFHSDKMPESVLELNKNKIIEYIGHKNVTQDIIDNLVQLKYEEARENKSHGEVVVEKLIQEGEHAIQEFVEMWREHFIAHANPKFMPKHWDLKRSASRLCS